MPIMVMVIIIMTMFIFMIMRVVNIMLSKIMIMTKITNEGQAELFLHLQ